MFILKPFIKTVDESKYKRTFNEELAHQENVYD